MNKKWFVAIDRWQDRESAAYYPINSEIQISKQDGKNITTIFDAYGRAVGEPYFGFPRLPYEEITDSDGNTLYKRFEDGNTKIPIFKQIIS